MTKRELHGFFGRHKDLGGAFLFFIPELSGKCVAYGAIAVSSRFLHVFTHGSRKTQWFHKGILGNAGNETTE